MERKTTTSGVSILLLVFFIGCDQNNKWSPTSLEGINAEALSKAFSSEIRLETRLMATAADRLASGNAKFEVRPDRTRFSVEVEDVSTRGNHEIKINGTSVDLFVMVNLGVGDLNLDSRDGDTVPELKSGDVVQVFNLDGTLILRGMLGSREVRSGKYY